MSELTDKLKGVTLDMSKVAEVINLEKKYNTLGSKRLDELLKYASPTGGEKSFFIFGYSECGQIMDAKIQALELQVKEYQGYREAQYAKVIELEKKLGEYKEKAWMYDQLNK